MRVCVRKGRQDAIRENRNKFNINWSVAETETATLTATASASASAETVAAYLLCVLAIALIDC